MVFAFSFLMMTGVSVFAQEVVKVAKDTTKTSVTTTTKVEPVKTVLKADTVKTEVKVAKDTTKTTVTTTTTKAELVKTEMKSADLPQPVKDLGASFKTQGWDTLEKAYVAKEANGDIVYYVVTFKNPTTGESKNIHIDAKGNVVNN